MYLLNELREVYLHAMLEDFSSISGYPDNVILGFVDSVSLLYVAAYLDSIIRQTIREIARIPALIGGDFPLD